jgi:hypothetical protein
MRTTKEERDMAKKVVEDGWGKKLFRRMSELGYKDVTEFVRDSKIELSFETCRRALHEGKSNIRHEHIVRLMQALDFTPQEERRQEPVQTRTG